MQAKYSIIEILEIVNRKASNATCLYKNGRSENNIEVSSSKKTLANQSLSQT
jgi:hypothetical protein